MREPMWQIHEYQDAVANFPHHQIDLDGKKFFYLPPLPDDEQFVPVLLGGCDVDSSTSSFRIEFYSYDDKEGTNGLGFRFEGPGSGIHDYWHLQINSIHGWHRWLPGTLPCVPVSARDPVGHLFALMVSLYGYRYIRGILDEMPTSRPFVARLEEVVQKIPH